MDSVVLEKEILKLPASEKAKLIDALWDSLDPASQSEIDRTWLRESQDRLKAFREGKLKALDGESVLREIESELGR